MCAARGLSSISSIRKLRAGGRKPSPTSKAEIPIIIIGGHVAALTRRTLEEEPVDYACNSEGPVTIRQLLDVLRADRQGDLAKVEGLAWRKDGEIIINPVPALIHDLDAEMPGDVWDLLPMDKYSAHNW
ncbi:MAG: putative Fe-S oxidoreductase [Rhodospirillaceae bacterium]|nr:MAG: putative Fe-S oxidoreductase [Rhodospirillaceae bacterium]